MLWSLTFPMVSIDLIYIQSRQLITNKGGISNFFSQLIVSFGYTSEQSLLYGTPGGAVEIVAIMAWAFYTQYYPNQRIWFSGLWLCVALIGIILIVALPLDVKAGRLAGYYLTQASPVPFVCLLSLIATNVAGYTKKTTVAAMYLIGYCIGNISKLISFFPAPAPFYHGRGVADKVHSWSSNIHSQICPALSFS